MSPPKIKTKGVPKRQRIGNIALTERQYRFCYEYLVDFNQTSAALRAGYAKRGAEVSASGLMAKPDIQKAIDILRKEELRQTKLSKDELVLQISECAARNAKDLFTKDGVLVLNHTLLIKKGATKLQGMTIHDLPDAITRSIDGVKQRCVYNPSDESISVTTELKLVGKASAWDMLMKHFGAYAPDKSINLNLGAQLPPDFYSPTQEVDDPIQKALLEIGAAGGSI